MTENDQEVRAWLLAAADDEWRPMPRAREALALLDAKDAEIAAWKEHAIRNSREADAALSRAEQAEAERDSARAVAESYRKACNDASEAGYLAAKSDFEAALAEERKEHQAFREEVSEAVENAETVGDLFHFILPAKPAVDPLVEALRDALPRSQGGAEESIARDLRAALARRHGTISFENSGGRYPAKDRDVLLHDGGRAPGSPHSIERADGRGRA